MQTFSLIRWERDTSFKMSLRFLFTFGWLAFAVQQNMRVIDNKKMNKL